MKLRSALIIAMCLTFTVRLSGEEAVSSEEANVKRLLALTPQILATGDEPATERMRAGVVNIFRAQETERARLAGYRDLPDAVPDHAPFLMVVGYNPTARQFDALAVSNPVLPGSPLTTSSPALAYALADMGLQFADTTVQGAPGKRYLSKIIAKVDERSSEFGGGYAVANRDNPQPGATLTSALALMAAPTLDRKVANADLLRGVIQTYDLILQQLSAASAFAELRILHRHAVLRIQLGGIPDDFLYDGQVERVTSHAKIIAGNALAVYMATASVMADEIDDGSLKTWMNTVFNKRFTVNRGNLPDQPATDSYMGDEEMMLGKPATVDDLVTTTIGLAAAYATSVAQELTKLGMQIDSDVDQVILEINAFDNYMTNVWAVDHSRNADGSIDMVKLNNFRAIIRPAMQAARERAIEYFNERSRLAFARGDALLRSANSELGSVVQVKAAELAGSGALVSEFVDRVLASRLGDKAMPANPLFVVNALADLHADLDRAIAAAEDGTAGTTENPPLVDADAIAVDADQWLYATDGWRTVTQKYNAFPYPAAVNAMTLQDHLTGLWISALGAVDALGAADETDNQPAAVRGAYRVVRGSPYLLMQELGSLADYKAIIMGMRDASSERTRLAAQFAAEFGAGGRLVLQLKDVLEAVKALEESFTKERQTRLTLEVPSHEGNALLVGRLELRAPRQSPLDAPLAGGVQGFIPLQANLAGYGVVMAQINHEITNAAMRSGKILSIAQRRLLVRSGLLSVSTPGTALVSPSSLLLMDMRRAVAIQLGRALRDAASFRPEEGNVRPSIPEGALPHTGRQSSKYQVELLGDAAAAATATKVATWILQQHDHGMHMQWASYRIAALRVALQDLDALASSAYAQSLVEQQRAESRNQQRVNRQRRQERE